MRSLLAKLGYRSLNEIIGRTDLLRQNSEVHIAKTNGLDLSCLINLPSVKEDRSWLKDNEVHTNGAVLDDELLADEEIKEAIANHGRVTKEVAIINNRPQCRGQESQARSLNNTATAVFLEKLPSNSKGAAGQSFGAFNLPGMNLILEGEANDYVAKGNARWRNYNYSCQKCAL